MNRLVSTIKAERFAWQKYLGGRRWHGLYLLATPLHCSYGIIGYTVSVYSQGRNVATVSHDWEMNNTKVEYYK